MMNSSYTIITQLDRRISSCTKVPSTFGRCRDPLYFIVDIRFDFAFLNSAVSGDDA